MIGLILDITGVFFLGFLFLYLLNYDIFRGILDSIYRKVSRITLYAVGTPIAAVLIIAKFLYLLVVSIIILIPFSLTALVPVFGKKNLEKTVRQLMGETSLQELRDDLVGIVADEGDSEGDVTSEDLESIRIEAKRRYEHGELIFTLGASVLILLSKIVPIQLPSLSFGISLTFVELVLIVVTATMAFRIILLDVLAYSEEDQVTEGNLKVAVAWQRAVTQFDYYVQPAILTMAFIKRTHRTKTYELAKKVLEDAAEEDIGVIETIMRAWQHLRN